MIARLSRLRPGLPLAAKIMGCLIALVLGLAAFLYKFNTHSFSELAEKNADLEADRICETIKSGASSSMMRNERGELQKIVARTGRMEGISGVRILNKEGLVMFASREEEVGERWPTGGFQCASCHERKPVPAALEMEERTRIEEGPDGERRLTIFSPIINDEGCATASCHFHRPEEKVLGVLVLDMALHKQKEILEALVESNTVSLCIFLAGVFVVLYAVVYILIQRPIRAMISVTRRIADGEMNCTLNIPQRDELGELADAIGQMCREISSKHGEINTQRQLYQKLFEGVPCIITVQDRDFRLLRYNQTFSDLFHVSKGAYCYEAYKGRTEKCPQCPVEKTFQDGQPHFAEETGVYKDGTSAHWIVKTSPLYDEDGNITAAMEMCLDITPRKRLEEELRKSDRKYQDIFNNIPNALFVIDATDMTILDVNRSTALLYGYRRGELIGQNIRAIFHPDEAEAGATTLGLGQAMYRVRNQAKDGRTFYVNIITAISESDDRKVVLATATDVTERIRAERQMVQASKMATLGEMATGVAHELNQPLAVMQMVANLFLRKIERGQVPDEATLREMADKLRNNVERSTRIINHMREFGRKPATQDAEPVDLNMVVRRAFDFFSQQLKVRGIEVVFDLAEELPPIMADPNRLEQVFMNLLLNARDAIEDKCAGTTCGPRDRRITLRTRARRRTIMAEVADTGVGIPRDIASRIFEPFFTTKQVGKGTGLGLSISYGIVQDYGGTIHARPRSGQGARFILVFPRTGANGRNGSSERPSGPR